MKQLKVTHFVLRNHCQGEEWNVTCVAEMLRSQLGRCSRWVGVRVDNLWEGNSVFVDRIGNL